jgi:3-hydroxybutyryl-CoA dehydrogenase
VTQSIAVIGAGVMGAGIAQVLATAGYGVRLYDIDRKQIDTAGKRILLGRFGLRGAVERGLLTQDQAEAALARLTYTTDLEEACDGAALTVEAVPEDLGLKMRVFRDLDRLTPADAVLTSNSAGLPIVALALVTARPEQVLGWHWAQPTAVMRLAELVVHDDVADAALQQVTQAALACGKNPVVVRDQPRTWGYVPNRINAAVRAEAAKIVEEGVATKEQVDTLVKDCFRWPMGPFELQEGDGLG